MISNETMYEPNSERISRVKALRAQGFTIDKIAAVTGYPRSSVGYYITKYCHGKKRARITISDTSSARPSDLTHILESTPDRVESYMNRIEKNEKLALSEILEGKSPGDRVQETIVLDMLERDPETLGLRLGVIEQLIKLAPFLGINVDRMRKMIKVVLTEDRQSKEKTETR